MQFLSWPNGEPTMLSLTDADIEVLFNLSLNYLQAVRDQQPAADLGVIFRQLNLHQSPLLELLSSRLENNVSFDNESRNAQEVLSLYHKGVWSNAVISEETGVPIEDVNRIIRERSGGYGNGLYGKAPLGRSKSVASNGKSAVRRVSIIGQFTYRRRLYTLGLKYRGRIAMLKEDHSRLVASFIDRPAVIL